MFVHAENELSVLTILFTSTVGVFLSHNNCQDGIYRPISDIGLVILALVEIP